MHLQLVETVDCRLEVVLGGFGSWIQEPRGLDGTDTREVESRKRAPEKDPWGLDLERPSVHDEALEIWKSGDGNGTCGWGRTAKWR